MNNKLAIQGSIEIGRSRYSNEPYSPEYIGGNGILASLAASKKTAISLIGVIGTDLLLSTIERALNPKITLESISQMKGQTFHWSGTYDKKTQYIIDQAISFGVYEFYEPQLAETTKSISSIHFSGSNPNIGMKTLTQFDNLQHIGVDTMMYHLQHNFSTSLALIEHAHYLFVNHQEYAYLQEKLGKDLSNFPEGSKMVKLQWKPKKSTEAPFAVDVPDVFSQAFVMEKNSAKFPTTGGWGYALFNYEAASDKFTADPSPADCGHACHV